MDTEYDLYLFKVCITLAVAPSKAEECSDCKSKTIRSPLLLTVPDSLSGGDAPSMLRGPRFGGLTCKCQPMPLLSHHTKTVGSHATQLAELSDSIGRRMIGVMIHRSHMQCLVQMGCLFLFLRGLLDIKDSCLRLSTAIGPAGVTCLEWQTDNRCGAAMYCVVLLRPRRFIHAPNQGCCR